MQSECICWLMCCCASTCCAGVLCAVLWARFLEVPELLMLSDHVHKPIYVKDYMPAVAICLRQESVADIFLEELSIKPSVTNSIPITFANLLSGEPTAKDQVLLLEELLASNNVTLFQVMMNYTPSCNEHTKRCRYQKKMWPCEHLFEKEITFWGLCCVMRPKKLSNVPTELMSRFQTTQMLDLVLQCSHGSVLHDCLFLIYYEGEEWVEPDALSAGYYYMAELRFTNFPKNPYMNPTSLVEKTCVQDKSYSRDVCMRRCAEKTCGCSDPLQYTYYSTNSDLPVCPTSGLGCLRPHEYDTHDLLCHCLPACKKLTTYMILESSPMSHIKEAIDPLYSGLNATSTVVNLKVNVRDSRVFLLNPTETWITLLSSLGGVFNMFLGVGLFSVLELLYFLIAKLPAAIRK